MDHCGLFYTSHNNLEKESYFKVIILNGLKTWNSWLEGSDDFDKMKLRHT